MVVDFNRVTGGFIEAPRIHLSFNPRADVGWPWQMSRNLQRGDVSLMIGQAPDATKRLKQANEIQIGDFAMDHLEIQRWTFSAVPVDDRFV